MRRSVWFETEGRAMRKAPTKSVMVIRTCDIEGIPKVRAMAQWIPYRGRCWWTGKALAARGGVQPNRTTGRFIRRLPNGWELQVLSRNLQPRRLDTALGIENKRYRMPDADQWSSYYKEAPDGRRRITSAALMALGIKYPDRVLDADLWGKPAKVVLLDVPHKVAGRVDSDPPQYLLKRLRLHDLPGWPPRLASVANVKALPTLMDCTLREASFHTGNGPGQESVELVLGFERKKIRAWLTGCPIPLMKHVAATLSQPALIGRQFSELQDVHLI
jgi:hypothetical protein